MGKKRKPCGYWNYQRCANEALKFKTRTAFRKGSISAYNAARRKGWLPAICAHMEYTRNPSGYWIRERVQAAALKYSSRSEFANNEQSAYDAAKRHGYLNQVCAHMQKRCLNWKDLPPLTQETEVRYECGSIGKDMVWQRYSLSKAEVEKICSQFESKLDFIEAEPDVFSMAIFGGYLEEVTAHMV